MKSGRDVFYIYIYIYIHTHTYIYIYIYIYKCKSINGGRINYKYIIATKIFMCVITITIFRVYNMEKNCLMLHLYDCQSSVNS